MVLVCHCAYVGFAFLFILATLCYSRFGGYAVVLLIEMLIHTQYVLTADDVLLIESGRFVPNVKIAVRDIKSVRKVRSAALFQPALSFSRLELTYETAGKIQTAQVSPKNTDDFIRCLCRKNPSIQQL